MTETADRRTAADLKARVAELRAELEAAKLLAAHGTVGARIREARLAQGWNQERLAEKAGIGWRTVRRIEAGEGFHFDTLVAIAEALGTTPAELLAA